MFIKKMANNIFVYWSAGLGAGQLTIIVGTGGWGINQEKLPTFDKFLVLVSREGDARGWN